MRYAILDCIRIGGIACIVTAHGLQAAGAPSFYLGQVGVSLMLMLSGLVLRLNQRSNGFLLSRLKRIYPTYWLCVAVSVLIGLLGQSALPTDSLDALLMLTGFCAFAARWGCHLHTSWFIGLIVSLYLLYPWLARAIRNAPTQSLMGLLAVSAISAAAADAWLPAHAVQWFPLARVFEFGLGIYLAEMACLPLAAMGETPRWLAWASDLSFPVFLVHYQLVPVFWHLSMPWPAYLVATVGISAMVLVAERYIQASLRLLSNRYSLANSI